MEAPLLYDLAPGARFEGDWYHGRTPDNIVVGKNTRIDSSACFKYYRATGPVEGRHMRPFVNWLNSHKLPGEKPYRVVAGP